MTPAPCLLICSPSMHPTGLVFIWIWEGLLVVSGRGGLELRSHCSPFGPATLAPSVPPQPPWLVHSSAVSAFMNLNPICRPLQRRSSVRVCGCAFRCPVGPTERRLRPQALGRCSHFEMPNVFGVILTWRFLVWQQDQHRHLPAAGSG